MPRMSCKRDMSLGIHEHQCAMLTGLAQEDPGRMHAKNLSEADRRHEIAYESALLSVGLTFEDGFPDIDTFIFCGFMVPVVGYTLS